MSDTEDDEVFDWGKVPRQNTPGVPPPLGELFTREMPKELGAKIAEGLPYSTTRALLDATEQKKSRPSRIECRKCHSIEVSFPTINGVKHIKCSSCNTRVPYGVVKPQIVGLPAAGGAGPFTDSPQYFIDPLASQSRNTR